MCGIVGYIGKSGTLRILIDGLKRLEYRGYDSAGIAFRNGGGIEVYKTKGKVSVLQGILPDHAPSLKSGLGHTRWATHGAPSTINAHPHCAEGVVVVHNGIIENYRDLRSRLEACGHTFVSETDTEVVPHLIARHLKEGLSLRDAIQKAVPALEGSYALGIMSAADPDMLFAVRRGSPLVIGIGNGEYYFASDIPAILPYTRKCVFMEDGQLCVLTAEGIELQHIASGAVIPASEQARDINWSPETAEKGGYGHFMHKEIHEQPRAVRDTLGEWMADPLTILDRISGDRKTVSAVRKLHIAACGTSYHAALIGKYLIERLARVPVDVDIASEYRYREPLLEDGTLFISISQSGETADTLAAQREAKARGAATLTISNVVGSTSSREADGVLYTRAGPEIGVASTKAFTAQLAVLCLFAVALGSGKGSLPEKEADTLFSQLSEIPALIDKVLSMDTGIKGLAGSLVSATDFLYLGRGINYPIALEGALKLKEISYIHAEGYPGGEMKHGPIALIEEKLPVVVLAPGDILFDKMLSNIEEVKARGGRIIAVTDRPDALRSKADDLIEVPAVHPLLAPLVAVVPLQLLAYHIGVLRGCDVDQPRNLAKSVTVE